MAKKVRYGAKGLKRGVPKAQQMRNLPNASTTVRSQGQTLGGGFGMGTAGQGMRGGYTQGPKPTPGQSPPITPQPSGGWATGSGPFQGSGGDPTANQFGYSPITYGAKGLKTGIAKVGQARNQPGFIPRGQRPGGTPGYPGGGGPPAGGQGQGGQGGGGQNLSGLMQGFTPEWNGTPLDEQRLAYKWAQMTPEQRQAWAARKAADDTWGYFDQAGGTEWAENAKPKQIYNAWMNVLRETGIDNDADYRYQMGAITEEQYRKMRRRAGLDPNILPEQGAGNSPGWQSQGLRFPGDGGLDGIEMTPALQQALATYSGTGPFGSTMYTSGVREPGTPEYQAMMNQWAKIERLAGQDIPFMEPGAVYNYFHPAEAIASAQQSALPHSRRANQGGTTGTGTTALSQLPQGNEAQQQAQSGQSQGGQQTPALGSPAAVTPILQQMSKLQSAAKAAEAAGLPLDPQFEMQMRLLNDQLQAQLAPLSNAREQTAAYGTQQSARLNTNQQIDYQSLLDNLASRGIAGSGIQTQNMGDLETNYLRQRQDLGNQLIGQYGDIAGAESGAYLDYNQQLMEALMDLANRAALDESLPVSTTAPQGGGNWQPKWQPKWKPPKQRKQQRRRANA